mgnify:CR=1 FL=1
MPRKAEKIDFKIIHHLPNQLGECPVWDEQEELLYWVDIKARQILCHDPSTEITKSRNVPGRPGMLSLCKDKGLVVAQERKLQRFSFEKGLQEVLVQVEPEENEKVRINDSKVDRSGRLWLSSMADPGIPGEKHGSLFMWENGKPVKKMAGPLGVGNGMAFAEDGVTFWYADTHARTVWKCKMNPEDGSLEEQEVFAEYHSEAGRPDGACIDAEGFYWVAVVDGWRLDRFSPEGKLDRSLAVPFQKPSCPAFGGKDFVLKAYKEAMKKKYKFSSYGDAMLII